MSLGATLGKGVAPLSNCMAALGVLLLEVSPTFLPVGLAGWGIAWPGRAGGVWEIREVPVDALADWVMAMTTSGADSVTNCTK
jgi:hypothetical protein